MRLNPYFYGMATNVYIIRCHTNDSYNSFLKYYNLPMYIVLKKRYYNMSRDVFDINVSRTLVENIGC